VLGGFILDIFQVSQWPGQVGTTEVFVNAGVSFRIKTAILQVPL